MEHPTISDCDDPQCVAAPFWLRDAISVHQCPLCKFNVYDCSASPSHPMWHRITPPAERSASPNFMVGDWVRIGAGPYEGFVAKIEKIKVSDQVAWVILHLMGRHVPFWIELRNLRQAESGD